MADLESPPGASAGPTVPRRLRAGRLSVYVEPRDIWVGAYVAETAVYVCPLPLLVFRWTRRARHA